MKYLSLQASSALHKLPKNRFPFQYDLNPYRGCGHHCTYCFAQYTHEYLETKDFFNEIYFKENIVEKLEEKLKSRTWKGECISIGGITDIYQPLEKELEVMPKILRLMIRYENPISICTKSDLILRDLELLKELNTKAKVNIASSIITIDERVRQKLEPVAPPTKRRFKMLEIIKNEVGCNTGILLMPVMPFITDSKENLLEIYTKGKEVGVSYIMPGILNLKGIVKEKVFEMIDREFPLLKEKYKRIYDGAYVERVYKDAFYIKIRNILKETGFRNEYVKYEEKKQLGLF